MEIKKEGLTFDTGGVSIEALYKRPGGAPAYCRVCGNAIKTMDKCISIQGDEKYRRFYMHVVCSGNVLFKLMQVFTQANNGLPCTEDWQWQKNLSNRRQKRIN